MSVMRLRLYISLSLLVSFLISCAPSGEDRTERQDIFVQDSLEGISWSLSLPSGPYAYTDRIQAQLSLKITENSRAPALTAGQGFSLEPSGTVWGDFRVRRMGRSGASFRVVLIPRQTGECRISIPLYLNNTVDKSLATPGDRQPLLLLEPDLLLQVESQLSDEEAGNELAGLIPDNKSPSYGLWIVLSAAAVSTAALILFLFIRKRRHDSGRAEGVPESQNLNSFLEETTSLTGCEDSAELYRNIFRLLLSELEGLHPGLKGRGCSPAGLIEVLEQPSALNQWNLRSLYPLLERMEEFFFAPDSVVPDEAEFQEHRKLLKGWLTLMKEEHSEV